MFVKICGITRLDDALLAAELGATAVGFVFWPASPRFLDPFRARAIVQLLPPFVTPVGVFVDQPLDYVQRVASLVRLSAVQLHGDEPPTSYRAMKYPIVKAISLGGSFEMPLLDEVPERVTVLIDSYDPARRGGTGRSVDWRTAAIVAARRRTILSGGLSADNVEEAIATVKPFGVDVSSGVESAPGLKDRVLMRAFFDALSRSPEAAR